MKYSEALEGFLDSIREAQAQYNIAVTAEHEADDKTQDILHSLELEKNSYHDGARLSRALTKVRQDRREAKDTCQRLKPLVDWAGQNPKTVRALEQLLGNLRRAEKSLDNRFYRPKTDIVEQTLADRRILK